MWWFWLFCLLSLFLLSFNRCISSLEEGRPDIFNYCKNDGILEIKLGFYLRGWKGMKLFLGSLDRKLLIILLILIGLWWISIHQNYSIIKNLSIKLSVNLSSLILNYHSFMLSICCKNFNSRGYLREF